MCVLSAPDPYLAERLGLVGGDDEDVGVVQHVVARRLTPMLHPAAATPTIVSWGLERITVMRRHQYPSPPAAAATRAGIFTAVTCTITSRTLTLITTAWIKLHTPCTLIILPLLLTANLSRGKPA